MNKNTVIFEKTFLQTSTTQKHYQNIPSWNSIGRPEKSKEGTVGFNTETQSLEIKVGTGWLTLPMKKIE